MDGPCLQRPVSPTSALGCSPCSSTENQVCLLTPLLVRCHHSPGEVAGSDRSLGRPGAALAPAPTRSQPPAVAGRCPEAWAVSGTELPSRFPGLPLWLRGQRLCPQRGRPEFDPWVRKIPWRRKWQPTLWVLAWKIPWTRRAWRATVHRVTKSRTGLSDFTFFSLQLGPRPSSAKPTAPLGSKEKQMAQTVSQW